MTLSGARRFASSGQRSRETALASSAPMPPSATIGAPAASRSRNLLMRFSLGRGEMPEYGEQGRRQPALSVLGCLRK